MLKTGHRARFFQQLLLLVQTGTQLVQALEILAQGNRQDEPLMRSLQLELHKGRRLSEALARHPELFSAQVLGMVQVGENTGRLLVALDRCAGYYQLYDQQRLRLLARLTYPCIVLAVATLGLLGLLVFILPPLLELVLSLPRPPVWLKGLVQVLGYLSSPWFFCLVAEGVLIGGWMARSWSRDTVLGREWTDRLKVELPVLGPLYRSLLLVQFCDSLASTLVCGCALLPGLRLVAVSLPNLEMQSALGRARQGLEEGHGLAEALGRESDFFPRNLLHMITVGEESGRLEQMLTVMARLLEAEVEHHLEILSSLLEPAIMVFLGGLVGSVAALFCVCLSSSLLQS